MLVMIIESIELIKAIVDELAYELECYDFITVVITKINVDGLFMTIIERVY
jgi:hypothetical protein